MFSGIIVRGEGIGRMIGYPTANVHIAPEKTQLTDGVYAAWADFLGERYAAALVIQRALKKVEVYMLDFTGGDCYGKTIQVDPVQKVSEIEEKDGAALIKKIAEDITLVREILKA